MMAGIWLGKIKKINLGRMFLESMVSKGYKQFKK